MSKKYQTDLWIVGIVKQPIYKFLKTPKKEEIVWINPDHSYQFIADPFGIWKNKKLYIFVEFLDYRTKKGRIDCMIFDKNLKKISTQNVIKENSHLSYPYIIEDDNRIFMIPESSKSGKTYIYEAIDFPSQWKKIKEIIPNTPLVDASIIKYKSIWWMFYSLPGKNNRALKEMHIAYSDSLLGEWKKHANNPVSNDIKLSRPGGKPFLFDKLIHLPVQDSEKTYGAQINILKIICLSKDTFKAKKIKTLKANFHKSFNNGLHTLSECGPVTLIDCKKIDSTRSRRWIDWQRRIGRFFPIIHKIKT